MKLRSFSIDSYRSCVHTKFPLNAELTALIGINGAGKSNILNSILLLKKMFPQRFNPIRGAAPLGNHCRVSIGIERNKKNIYMSGKITFETDDRNSDDVQDSTLNWNFRNVTKDNNWQFFPMEAFLLKHDDYYAARIARIKRQRLEHMSGAPSKKVLSILSDIYTFFNGISYYSASQFSDPSRCPVSIELEEGRPIQRMRQSSAHYQFIFDLYKSFKAAGKEYSRYLSIVNKFGIGLIDKIGFKEVKMPSSFYEVQSGGKIKQFKKNRLLIIPSFNVDGNKLSPNQLSEGTFKTLALLFYVLTDDSRLLLIEEPEVCIHHGLLSSIITLIKSQSKNKQIIISTHSDFVLDHLEPENIVLVKRKGPAGTKATLLSKSMSKNDYDALRSYLKTSGNLGDYWKEGGFDNE